MKVQCKSVSLMWRKIRWLGGEGGLKIFYNNCQNSPMLIGSWLWSIRVQTKIMSDVMRMLSQ